MLKNQKSPSKQNNIDEQKEQNILNFGVIFFE